MKARLNQFLPVLLALNLVISSPLQVRHGDHEHAPAVAPAHNATTSAAQADANANATAHMGMGPSHSHGAVKQHFDPSSIPPDPLSYYVHDTEESDGHGRLMLAHIGFMTLAWMGFLPLCTLRLALGVHSQNSWLAQLSSCGLQDIRCITWRKFASSAQWCWASCARASTSCAH